MLGLIDKATVSRKGKAGRDVEINPSGVKFKAEPLTATAPPTCPVCTKPMVQRVAKRGSKSGNAFWGCSDFPSCRGTKQIG